LKINGLAVARQRPHSASAPEGQDPADKPPERKAPAPPSRPGVVIENEAGHEFVGEQRGLVGDVPP